MTMRAPDTLPKEIAGAVNLMAHPAAAGVAFSALGFAIASQMFGVWLGAMTGAAEATQRMFETLGEDAAPPEPARTTKTPTQPARSATITLLADVRSAAAGKAVRTSRKVEVPTVTTGPTKPKAIARPAQPDDLKLIAGISPKLEKVLNGLGVWTSAQIAAWTPEDIAWVENYLSFDGRIGRDEWIGQATNLSGRQGRDARQP